MTQVNEGGKTLDSKTGYKERKQFCSYSAEQKQQARDSDIIDLLGHYEGFSFKKSGSGYKCEQHDSLVINKDRMRWFWNSQHVKGNNAIDYLQTVKSLSFLETMDILVGKSNSQNTYKEREYKPITAPPVDKTTEMKTLELPEKAEGQYKKAFAYLNTTRGIAKEIINDLMSEKLIYQDKNNNVVFVGYDESNQEPNAKKAKFACVRGTLTQKSYRGDCTGSDKSFSFNMKGNNSEKLYVFEAPIDAMSHATLINIKAKSTTAWKADNRLALAGSSDVALEGYLSRNSSIKEIVFCLDNDETGIARTDEYLKKYSDKGFNVSAQLPRQKDYNDELKTFYENRKPKEKFDVLDQNNDVVLLKWYSEKTSASYCYSVHRIDASFSSVYDGKHCGMDHVSAVFAFCDKVPYMEDLTSLKGKSFEINSDGKINFNNGLAFQQQARGGDEKVLLTASRSL